MNPVAVVVVVVWVVLAVAGVILGLRAPREPTRDRGRERIRDEFSNGFVDPVVFLPGEAAQLPYGFLPAPLQPGAHPFDTALALPYRGHELLAFVRHVHVRTMDGTAQAQPWTYVQARVPPLPRIRLCGGEALREGPPPNLANTQRIHIGHDAFDRAFQLYTDNEQAARAVFHGPVLDYLAVDSRYHHKVISFDGDVCWLQMPTELDVDSVCVGADVLIDLLDRIPSTARNGGARR